MSYTKTLRRASLLALLSLTIAPAYADLADGRYGTAQVFDTQRNPAFPSAGVPITLSEFQRPFADVAPSGPYVILPGQYIQFFRADLNQAPGDLCNYGIRLYNADGSLVRTIAEGGAIFGLDEIGFLHTSDPTDFGTFVTNSEGYAFGGELTYTPSSGQATCSEAAGYAANTTPLYAPGPAAPTPIPSLTAWGLFLTTALVAMATFFGSRRRQD